MSNEVTTKSLYELNDDERSNIKKLVIEDGFTTIKELCLDYVNLEYVQLPNTLIEIGKNSFMNCKKLKSINIPNSVTSIGENAFQNTGFEKFKLSKNITNIGNSCFNSCEKLKSFEFNNVITTIPEKIFENCKNLENVNIGNTIKIISSNAFSNCEKLKNIDIPNTVSNIEYNAFINCKSLIEITIPNSIEYILKGAFAGCISLNKMIIENTTHNITKYNIFTPNGSEINTDKVTLKELIYYGNNNSYNNYIKNIENDNYVTIENIKKIIKINYVDQDNRLIKTDEYILDEQDRIEYNELNLPNDYIDYDKEKQEFNNEWYIDDNNKFKIDEDTMIKYLDISNITGDTIILKPLIETIKKPEYKIIFNYKTNGGSDIQSDIYNINKETIDNVECGILNIEEGSSLDLSKINATKEGYEFKGWSTKQTSINTIDTENKFILTSNITLYAVYYKQITANFYFGSSDYMQSTTSTDLYNNKTNVSLEITTNSYIDQLTYNNNNYTFKGWITEADYNTIKSSNNIVDLTNKLINNNVTISENTNFYAVYSYSVNNTNTQNNSYKVIYDLDDGTYIVDDEIKTSIPDQYFDYYIIYTNDTDNVIKEFQYNITLNIPEQEYTKEGYMFNGWYINNNGEKQELNNKTILTQCNDITVGIDWTNSLSTLTNYYNFAFDEENKTAVLTGVINDSKLTELMKNNILELPSKVLNDNVEYSVTYISSSAFMNCTSLTSIVIPDSVTAIDNQAFQGCTSLTSVTIPNSVTSIGGGVFDNTGIYNNEENWENNVLYIDNCLIEAKTNLSGDYTIKDNTRLIGGYAFQDCTSLTNIMIPNSVTSISPGAFENCQSLSSITIPDFVTSIGDGAFNSCSSLTSVMIPELVISIGVGAFWNCYSLASITIPDSVTYISTSAFENCTSLTSITIPNSVTSIGIGAFQSCSSLTSITIPNSITSIDSAAFQECTSLAAVYYSGTEEQWQNISIGSNNSCLTNANINYTGE